MRLLGVLLLCVLGLVPGTASGAPSESPEQFTLRFAETAKSGDWQAYSQLMHPDALAALKRIFADAISAETNSEVVLKLFGVSSVAEFQALPDAQVFVRLFVILEKNVPNFQSAVKNADFQAVGSVLEGPDVAHVVVRSGTKPEQPGMLRVSVMSLKRHQGEWKALLSSNLEALARQIAAARRAAPPK